MHKNKFRVWNKRHKNWLKNSGSLHCFSHYLLDINTGEIFDAVYVLDSDNEDCSKRILQNEPSYYFEGIDIKKESPFVVQQYTGMNDENDKELYEGDIVYLDVFSVEEEDKKNLFEIVSHRGAFQLKPIKLRKGGCLSFQIGKELVGVNEDGDEIWKDSEPHLRPICDFNIMVKIGNVFENPELL